MQVMKFGGTSVANSENMSKVVDIVAKAVERDRTILVSSAISGCTDTLIKIGIRASERDESYKTLIDELQKKHHDIIRELLPLEKHEESREVCDALFDSLRGIAQGVCLLGELSPASLDAIQSFGELWSTKILATKLASIGIATKWIDSRNIIRTLPKNGKNVVDIQKTYFRVNEMVENNPITQLFVVPGFIASDKQGRTTTLGRGGSDYTASLFAVGCKARILEIWTDVPGMMTSNPKVVPTARTISNISYKAALELSHFGAKVIYPPTIQPVVAEGIPIYIKDTFIPDAFGTLIEKNPPRSNDKLIGISNSDDIALLSLEGSGMVGIPGFSSRLFETFSQNDINIILITQASSVHTMCIAVSEKDAERAKEAADKCFAYEISLGKLNPLKVEKGFSIVCLVGDDVLNQSGTTGRMLAALGRHSIPVRATAQGSSERNVSIIISSKDTNEAILHIHNEFFDKTAGKDINLFIAGFGVVGKALPAPNWQFTVGYNYARPYEMRSSYSMGSTLTQINTASYFEQYSDETDEDFYLRINMPLTPDNRTFGSFLFTYDVPAGSIDEVSFAVLRKFHCWQLIATVGLDREYEDGEWEWDVEYSITANLTGLNDAMNNVQSTVLQQMDSIVTNLKF